MIERTPEAYAAAFEKERKNEYPVIDEFERRMGYAVDRERLEAAARVLACPIKKNPPNWQHGRVIYALGRSYLAGGGDYAAWLDIGTAKGFSAACMSWALDDAEVPTAEIQSVDIIDPYSTEPRNSIEDPKTAFAFIAPFVDGVAQIELVSKANWVIGHERFGFAFIDGSHTYEGVKSDFKTVAPRQQSGDIILFDDVNKPEVNRAVSELEGYDLEYIKLLPKRHYAIAVKR